MRGRKEELTRIAELVLSSREPGEEVEFVAAYEHAVSASVESNEIKDATSVDKGSMGIRVVKENRVGFASCHGVSEENARELLEKARVLARYSTPEEGNKLPEPSEGGERVLDLYEEEAEEFSAAHALDLVHKILSTARSYDKRVTVDSAAVHSVLTEEVVVNTLGIRRYQRVSAAHWLLMGMAREGDVVSSFDLEFDFSRNPFALEPEEKVKEFAERVVNTLGAEKGESFVGTAVLHPYAAEEVLWGPLVSALNGNSVYRKASPLAGKIGEQVTSEKVTLLDDAHKVEGAGATNFDREGLVPRPFALISKGVLRNYYVDYRTSIRLHRFPTGNAGGTPESMPYPSPHNVVIGQGYEDWEKLLADVEKGMFVRRFSGSVNPVTGVVSGVVKGGFLVEKGRFVKPVSGVMLTGNLYEMLKNVRDVSANKMWIFNTSSPYVFVDKVSFVAEK